LVVGSNPTRLATSTPWRRPREVWDGSRDRSGGQVHKVVGGLLVALLLVGCAEVVPTETPTANFTGYLAGYGQLFTPMVAPLDSDWRSAVAKGLQPGATLDRVESAIYGVVTCVDPAKN